jgi:transposase
MESVARRVAREVRQMTKADVIVKAIDKQISWLQAADILGVTPRHMRRLKQLYEQQGYDGLRDHRGGRPRRKRIPLATLEELFRLRRAHYADFSIQHFWEFATEVHGLPLSYTATRLALQAAGLAEKAPARGKYRRQRERRPLVGMLLHLDGSTHAWLPGPPMQDLIVLQDDADSRILYARFVAQEGTASTFAALHHVLTRYGRFCELYTDRGSHFCRTTTAGAPPDDEQHGQVARALEALGIRHIRARSPEARGRSERTFGTIQGRLPQELRLHGIRDYAAANHYLETSFVPAFNRRFTARPAQSGSAFTRLPPTDLALLLSVQHRRVVRNDSTVTFNGVVLQLPPTRERRHYTRCPVVVHEFPDQSLGLSYAGRLLARYTATGTLLPRRLPAAA